LTIQHSNSLQGEIQDKQSLRVDPDPLDQSFKVLHESTKPHQWNRPFPESGEASFKEQPLACLSTGYCQCADVSFSDILRTPPQNAF
jgi:hypothetical protein